MQYAIVDRVKGNFGLSTLVGPFPSVEAAQEYRRSNAMTGDIFILPMAAPGK